MPDDTFSNAEEGPTLSVDMLREMYQRLNALLPVAYYVASKHAPLVNSKGNPAICYLPRTVLHGLEMGGYFVVHPDNFGELASHCKGVCRLEPYEFKNDFHA